MADIEIDLPHPDPTPPAEHIPDPVTVIEHTAGDVSGDVMQELLDARERAVNAEHALETLAEENRLLKEATIIAAGTAQQTAESVQDLVEKVEDLAEGEQAPASEDEEPDREHLFFRPIGHSRD